MYQEAWIMVSLKLNVSLKETFWEELSSIQTKTVYQCKKLLIFKQAWLVLKFCILTNVEEKTQRKIT